MSRRGSPRQNPDGRKFGLKVSIEPGHASTVVLHFLSRSLFLSVCFSLSTNYNPCKIKLLSSSFFLLFFSLSLGFSLFSHSLCLCLSVCLSLSVSVSLSPHVYTCIYESMNKETSTRRSIIYATKLSLHNKLLQNIIF